MWARPARKANRLSMFAGALLAGLAAIGFAASPAAASSTVPAQSVTLEQTGGFAGVQKVYTVNQQTTDSRRAALLTKLAGADFRALSSSYGPASACCDRFVYELTVRYRGGQAKNVIAIDGSNFPTVLSDVIDLTRNIATSTGAVRAPQGKPSLLFVELAQERGTSPARWVIRCKADGTGSDACSAINAQTTTALTPVPSGAACTKVHGGPQIARVFGIWRGEWANASFSRANGCEIARWDLFAPMLAAPAN